MARLDLKDAFMPSPWIGANPARHARDPHPHQQEPDPVCRRETGYWYLYLTYRGVKYSVAMPTWNTQLPSFEYGRWISTRPRDNDHDDTRDDEAA